MSKTTKSYFKVLDLRVQARRAWFATNVQNPVITTMSHLESVLPQTLRFPFFHLSI